MKKVKCKANDDDEMCQDSLHWRVYYSTLRLKKKNKTKYYFHFANLLFCFYNLLCSTQTIKELKQTRRRQKRERHLKMLLRVSAVVFQLFKVIMFEKCVRTILELNWNQRLGHKKKKLNICHHMLTSSTHLQNWSFHVVERTRTSTKCQKMKNARAKRAKILFFHCQTICKFVRFSLPSWLLKAP